MHNRGVIAAAKAAPDFRQRPAGHFLAQIHGDMTRAGVAAQTLGADHVAEADVIMFGHLALDFFNADFALGRAEHVGKAILRQVHVDLAAHQ